jgi:arsenite-transporting ATPase
LPRFPAADVRHLISRHILFFGGKGGVGKTTCSAATALAASRQGKRVLLVSTDPAHSTADVLGCALGPDIRSVTERLRAIEIDAETEVRRYLSQAKSQLTAAFSPSVLKEALRQIEMTATMPGVADVAVFERMNDIALSKGEEFDLIVFDTAPTGHALRLLSMPESMGVWVRALAERRRAAHEASGSAGSSLSGSPISSDPVLETLERRAERLERVKHELVGPRAAIVLVLVPERLPIEETARSLAALQQADLEVGAVVVNRILPDGLTDAFSRSRKLQEQAYLDEIERRFASVPRIRVSQLATDVNGLADLERVACQLGA